MRPERKAQAPKGFNRQNTVESKKKARTNSKARQSMETVQTERNMIQEEQPGIVEMGEQPDTERNENNQVREVSNTEKHYSMNEENENKNV